MTKLFGSYSKRNRKASLQLSINAIVILVMAMAVLGLGLGLIRGVLGSGKDKLMNSLEGMDISEQATSENVITNVNNIKLKRGTETTVAVSYYGHSGCTDAFMNITCFEGSGSDVSPSTTFFADTLTAPIPLTTGKPTTLGSILTVNSSVTTGKHLCKVDIVCADEENSDVLDSKSIFVSVDS